MADTQVPVPAGKDKEAWANAEAAVLSKNGGFAGLSDEAKRKQVEEAYDQISDQQKQAQEWSGDNGVVGTADNNENSAQKKGK